MSATTKKSMSNDPTLESKERSNLIHIAVDAFEHNYFGNGPHNWQDAEVAVLGRLLDIGYANNDCTHDLVRDIVSDALLDTCPEKEVA